MKRITARVDPANRSADQAAAVSGEYRSLVSYVIGCASHFQSSKGLGGALGKSHDSVLGSVVRGPAGASDETSMEERFTIEPQP